jgi:hypothetical protein
MYRPQFAMPQAPEGFAWQPCIYQFDQNNVPAMGSLALATGQESGHIPLPLDKDAPFTLLGVKIQNGGFNLLLFDPWSNQLMDTYIAPGLYASDVPPFTVLEGPGIELPAGAVLSVRFQGQ